MASGFVGGDNYARGHRHRVSKGHLGWWRGRGWVRTATESSPYRFGRRAMLVGSDGLRGPDLRHVTGWRASESERRRDAEGVDD
jgi:hypothetical protein